MVEFNQRVKVNKDASLTVREDITVEAKGVNIRRGIFREFPTKYRWKGNSYTVGFRVKRVLRDGKPENWFTENLSNGVRVYVGKKDVFLDPGTYTYTLIYETDRQIGFFKSHDELYWNVNGTGWRLPMLKVRAVVELPGGVPKDSVRYTAYTGRYGERGKDYRAWIDDKGRVHFETTRPLMAGENLTVVVGWPKGYVKEPGLIRRLTWFLRDNVHVLILFLTVVAVFLYYLWAWAKVGKDPPKGTIMPEFKPPEGMSPAAVRYVMRMGYDDVALAANLIDLAVRGGVKIRERGKGDYTIVRIGQTPEGLPEDEVKMLKLIVDTLKIEKGSYSKRVKKLSDGLAIALARLWGHLFRLNLSYVAMGVVLSLVGVLLAFLLSGSIEKIIKMVVVLAVGLSFMAWIETALSKNKPLLTVVRLLFLVVVGLIYVMIFGGSVLEITAVLILIGVNVFFGRYMSAPTYEGRRLMDRIEGLKMFLETAEKDRLKALFPKDSVPRIFERFLPYALALDVADTWADKFAEDLKAVGYRPEWYEGPHYARFTSSHAYSGFVRDMSSGITTAVASASRPPSSSSGFSGSGGGGFSGGGGGGGGGGGW